MDHLDRRRADRRLHGLRGRSRRPDGSFATCRPASAPAVIGALLFTMTGFGLGWVNAAADYSRYLPAPRRTAASSAGPRSATSLRTGHPAAVRHPACRLLRGPQRRHRPGPGRRAHHAFCPPGSCCRSPSSRSLGLIGGAMMDIYSSGLSLLNLGCRAPRWVAACIDGIIMLVGAVYVVFFSTDFLGPFQGFLITLGVPIAAWCGIFLADVALRRRDYAEPRPLRPARPVRRRPVGARGADPASARRLAGGWSPTPGPPGSAGRATCSVPSGWVGWKVQWAYANLGVIVALIVGFLGLPVVGSGHHPTSRKSMPDTAERATDQRAGAGTLGCRIGKAGA